MPTASMTKQHYVLIADAIRRLSPGILSPAAQALVALAFADRLEGTNPLFNRTKFLAACGTTTEN